MNKNFKSVFEPILPFLILGIAIALIMGVFIMLSYVFLWGLIIGVVIWLVISIKNYFFPKPKANGRIIEHDKDDL